MEPWQGSHPDAESAMAAAEAYVQRWQEERDLETNHGRDPTGGLRKVGEAFLSGEEERTKLADRHFRQGAEWLARGRLEEAMQELKRARSACPKWNKRAKEKVDALLRVAELEQERTHRSVGPSQASVETKREDPKAPSTSSNDDVE